ncbi:hypothetical protein MHYP_G00088780 [Metynnis hypsauchen]
MKSVGVMMLFLHCALSEKFELVGQVSPVVATAGSDVVLPCSVRHSADQSSLSAVNMNITWTRSDLGDALVHFYGNREDMNTRQIPHYRGRTALFTEELQNGNVSLSLSDVSVFDEGEYRCNVESREWERDFSFKIRVEVIGTRPLISVERYDEKSEQFSLLCESKGWRPQPDLQWLDREENNLTAGDTESHREVDLFTVKRRITVYKTDIDNVYCRVTLGRHIREERVKPSAICGKLLHTA